MIKFIVQALTWWNGRTVGTWLHTLLHGRRVGVDAAGNVYYESRRDGRRRWVIYNGESEASRVPPDWHGWLHHTFERPPTEVALPRKSWEQSHVENRTGLASAYRPSGSLHGTAARPHATGDYEPWVPPAGRET